MKNETENQTEMNQILGFKKSRFNYQRAVLWILPPVIVIIVLVLAIRGQPQSPKAVQFKTEEVSRGNLVVTVTATGNLEPVNQVEVGTEVSGTIRTVAVDYNDLVKAGQVLAELDTTKLAAQVLQSKASLASAKAELLTAYANIEKAKNELQRLRRTWELSGGKVPSRQEMEEAEIAVRSAQAQEAVVLAQIDQAQAALDANQTDLAKAIIRSPINGIILERNVEPGQTVAASLQTPVLFTLAEDLAWMELQVDVDEADIGQVKEGQKATFTVDAYPERSFAATIKKVRFAPQTENGVVTYKTLLEVNNSELVLRPGMTATADIIVSSVSDALLVPNAALRFSPPQLNQKPQNEEKRGLVDSIFPRPHRGALRPKKEAPTATNGSVRIWKLAENRPVPITVKVGTSDGVMTEVTDGGVKLGEKVIVGVIGSDK